jgi:hypothetical protein
MSASHAIFGKSEASQSNQISIQGHSLIISTICSIVLASIGLKLTENVKESIH